MRTLRLVLAVLVTGALLGGAVTAQSEESEALVFPTGTFVSVENPSLGLEFNEDGTGLVFAVESWEVVTRYGVSGDLWTEMTSEYPGSEFDGSQTPATYYWDFDGEHLTFELWGEDLRPHRISVYQDNTWAPMVPPTE